MLIKDWLSEFIVCHQRQHPRDDWPIEGSGSGDSRALWCQWLERLIAEHVTQAEAHAASNLIDGSVLERWEDHLSSLVLAVAEVRKQTAARAVRPTSEDARLAEAKRAIDEVNALDLHRRRAMAGRLIDEFHELGWEFRWIDAESQFRTFWTHDDAPPVPMPLSTRLRALKAEVYMLLGHPLPEDSVVIPECVDPRRWREMVRETPEGLAVIGGPP